MKQQPAEAYLWTTAPCHHAESSHREGNGVTTVAACCLLWESLLKLHEKYLLSVFTDTCRQKKQWTQFSWAAFCASPWCLCPSLLHFPAPHFFSLGVSTLTHALLSRKINSYFHLFVISVHSLTLLTSQLLSQGVNPCRIPLGLYEMTLFHAACTVVWKEACSHLDNILSLHKCRHGVFIAFLSSMNFLTLSLRQF